MAVGYERRIIAEVLGTDESRGGSCVEWGFLRAHRSRAGSI